MGEDETLSEYLERVMRADRKEIREQLGFVPVYETVLYSDRELTEADIRTAEQTNRKLREMAKKSKLKYRLLLIR